MKRLALWVTLLTSFFFVLIFGTQSYGQTLPQNNPLLLLGFDLCKEQPCFSRLLPGEIELREAKNLLLHNSNSSQNVNNPNQFEITANQTVFTVSVWGSSSIPTSLSEIRAQVDKLAIPLSAIILMYGEPCSISLFPVQCNTYNTCSGIEWMSFYYPSMIVGIKIKGPIKEVTRLYPNLSINTVEILDPKTHITTSKPCHIYSEDEISSSGRPWLGFVSIRHYMEFKGYLEESDNFDQGK